MEISVYMGIDPGKSGGISFINSNFHEVCKMPDTIGDLADFFKELRDNMPNFKIIKAAIEDVHCMHGDGRKSAFTFGKGVGSLQMGLYMAGIPFVLVAPQRWQKDLNCLTKGNKNITKNKAQQLFPSLKITHAVADALLIGEWLRQKETTAVNNGSICTDNK